MVYRRQHRRGSDTQMHPTYEKILNTAVEVLIEQGFDKFNVQTLLDRAEISRGTLYHHYGEVDSVIEAALAASFSRELSGNRAALEDLVDRCKTTTEFRRELRRLIDRYSDLPASVRVRRAHTISLCQTRPELADAIRAEQDNNNRAWQELIELAQAKGFARKDLDSREGAAIVQGIGISRIVDEVSSEPLSNERWADLTFKIYDALILAPAC
jgi:AcrR family transcriptional regulator